MDVTYTHCAGLDVHKKVVVACSLIQVPSGKLKRTIRSFGTTTAQLLSLSDWLNAQQINQFNQQIDESINEQNLEHDLPLPKMVNKSTSSSKTAENSALSWNQAVILADTIPGVAQNTAELLIAEIGTELLHPI